MSYTLKYKQFMIPEARVSKGEIKPRNIYRISTYSGSKPNTKVGMDSRYVFVLGKIENKIHCIKLNDILPLDFTNFINTLREKRVPIKQNQRLSELLKLYPKNGKLLFEQKIKNNSKIYGPDHDRYRIYILDKIKYVSEIRFEEGFLRTLFGEKNKPTTGAQKKAVIKDELDSKDKFHL